MSDWFMSSVLTPMRQTLADPGMWPDLGAPSTVAGGSGSGNGGAPPQWFQDWVSQQPAPSPPSVEPGGTGGA
jgi:hypothetical protein